jgi:hypothetical protein
VSCETGRHRPIQAWNGGAHKTCVGTYSIAIVFIIFALVCSCAHAPPTESWKKQYSHLQRVRPQNRSITETDYYIVFLVAAYHLDYLDNRALIHSLIDYGRRKGDIGHSWVYLKGIKDSEPYILEGGQSGQLGKTEPRFYEGVNNYIKFGYADPSNSQKANPRYEPNPIKYLWEDLEDGFFQKGNGGHRPTYAAKVDLTKRQFNRILDFMDPGQYDYETFSLVGNQCSSFVAEVASIAGLPVEDKVTVKIASSMMIGKKEYRLWTDPKYSEITFSSPDVIERSLMEAVSEGRAEYALGWYFDR